MNMRMKNYLRRFRKEERGSVFVIEFVILVPALFIPFFFGFEMSMHSIRQMQLDRAVEVTTRQIRLNTSKQFTHETIVKTICANSGGLQDCEGNLRLEMVQKNLRAYTPIDVNADCINAAEPVAPVRGWNLGEEHELMILRACYRYVPLWNKMGLGKELDKNDDGYGEMVSISAFSQEPK